ncbi:MAG TPA: preprotein translocase subunit SecG [Rickettsiales bacterium]|nr:preprotein translocase subunit SecG [Rickettsiales bacterium]
MYTVLIVIHALVTLALIGIILVQRSDDSMGLSGSSNTSFMSGRAAASFLTRTTAVLATIFILLSLAIGILTSHNHDQRSGSIVDKIANTPAPKVEPQKEQAPAKPEQPAVPRPE